MSALSCRHCAKAGAMTRCSKCRIIAYCGAACQKADWARHKRGCKCVIAPPLPPLDPPQIDGAELLRRCEVSGSPNLVARARRAMRSGNNAEALQEVADKLTAEAVQLVSDRHASDPGVLVEALANADVPGARRTWDWARIHYLQGGLLHQSNGALTEVIAQYQLARGVLTPHGREVPLWATLTALLADAYRDLGQDPATPAAQRREFQEKAVGHYEAALFILSRPEMNADERAKAQINLGVVLQNRIAGDRADNQETAIALYNAAARGSDVRASNPSKWGHLQFNLGHAYKERLTGDAEFNLEQAIVHYTNSLEVLTAEADTLQWLEAHQFLGHALRFRSTGKREDNISEGIAHYEAMIQVHTREASPIKHGWALTQIGLAYFDRAQGGNHENRERAIDLYERALEVLDHDTAPREWAQAQAALGTALCGRVGGDAQENVERVITHCEAALSVYGRETDPEVWSHTQSYLQLALQQRDLDRSRQLNVVGVNMDELSATIARLQAPLGELDKTSQPLQWVDAQFNLACTLLAAGGTIARVEEAIAHFEEALECISPSEYPRKWASVHIDIAHCHFVLTDVDPTVQRLQKIIYHNQQALHVTALRSEQPQRWAWTQFSLAVAFATLPSSHDRTANQEMALTHFEAAMLQISADTDPDHYIAAMLLAGGIYLYRHTGDRTANVKAALTALYDVEHVLLTRPGGPGDGMDNWYDLQAALGVAHYHMFVVGLGTREQTLEASKRCLAAAARGIPNDSENEIAYNTRLTLEAIANPSITPALAELPVPILAEPIMPCPFSELTEEEILEDAEQLEADLAEVRGETPMNREEEATILCSIGDAYACLPETRESLERAKDSYTAAHQFFGSRPAEYAKQLQDTRVNRAAVTRRLLLIDVVRPAPDKNDTVVANVFRWE